MRYTHRGQNARTTRFSLFTFAYLILAEIEDEKRWAENFANFQDQLAQLAKLKSQILEISNLN